MKTNVLDKRHEKLLFDSEMNSRTEDTLGEKLKVLKSELQTKKLNFQETLNWNEQKSERKIESLENSLNLFNKRLSTAKLRVHDVRDKIDSVKREQLSSRSQVRDSERRIKKLDATSRIYKSETERKTLQVEKNSRKIRKTHVNILEGSKSSRNEIKKLEKKLVENMKYSTPAIKERARTPPSQIFNYLRTLRILSDKWIQKSKQSAKKLKQIQNEYKSTLSGFNTIGKSINTYIITDITKEIIESHKEEAKQSETFIKTLSKTEKIEIKLKKVNDKIYSVRVEIEENRKKRDDFIAKKETKLKRIKDKIDSCEENIRFWNDEMTVLGHSSRKCLHFLTKLQENVYKWKSHRQQSFIYSNDNNPISIVNQLEQIIKSTEAPKKYNFNLQNI